MCSLDKYIALKRNIGCQSFLEPQVQLKIYIENKWNSAYDQTQHRHAGFPAKEAKG